MEALAPSNPKDRFEVYRFFNGLSAATKDGLDKRYVRVPFVKTFLLEHVSCRGNIQPKPPAKIFQNIGAEIKMLDDHFMSLAFELENKETKRVERKTTGFLEQYDERFFAYYTSEDSASARKRVEKWIHDPDLDFTWFSSELLQQLWDRDIKNRGDNRFGKLVFKHWSIFDMPEDFAISEEESEDKVEDEENEEENTNEEDIRKPEGRKARFEMGDRIGKIKAALKELQNNYDPLHAMYALRLPSLSAHGSHDLYQKGQITNRTDSFEDHRNTVRYLYRIYKSILSFTEECAWHKITQEQTMKVGFKGVPLIVKFIGEALSEPTFNRWVQMAFRKGNLFKLWGDPIRLGPTKVHVYGADRHLWQSINLEITSKGLVAILPQGTCGNTFHRLVTNIQHYVSPKIEAWVGSEPFKSVVSKWSPNMDNSDGY